MAKTRPRFQTESIIKTWPMVRLGEVCEVQRGGSPRPIKDYITDSTEGLNWIKIGDVEPAGKYITQTVEKIKASGLNKTRKVSAGDFLLSNSMSFGRPYILKIDGCIHDGWLVLKGFSKTFTEDFFYYLLRSPIVQEQFDKLAHGSTVRNLNTDVVSRVSLPLPPFSVQCEIVARLERELAAVEKMKKGFEELAETAKAEFKSELKEVFEEISRGGAETRRLGAVCEFENGDRGSNYPAKSKLLPNGEIPFISAINIANRSIREDNLLYLSQLQYEKLRAGKLQKGDIALCIRGSLGKFCIYSYERGAIASSLVILRCKELLSVGFLANFLESDLFFKQVAENGTGTAQPNLAAKNVMSFEIPLPSLAVQREVVARLDSAKARAEKLEAKAREGVAVCETMRKAILKEAF